MHLRTVCQAIMVMTLASVSSALAAPTCPIDFGKRANLKPNKLYLFFPAAELKKEDKSGFPSHGFDTEF